MQEFPLRKTINIMAYLFVMGYFEIYKNWFAPYKSYHIIRVYNLETESITWKLNVNEKNKSIIE